MNYQKLRKLKAQDFFKLLFLSLLIVFLQSCIDIYKNSRNEELLLGSWTITSIKYNNIEYYDYMLTDAFIFEIKGKRTHSVYVPESIHFKRDNASTWYLDDDDKNHIFLDITSTNLIFNRRFELDFQGDNIKELYLDLKSDTVYIQAKKFFLNPR